MMDSNYQDYSEDKDKRLSLLEEIFLGEIGLEKLQVANSIAINSEGRPV